MFQAIEVVYRAGKIMPVEPVQSPTAAPDWQDFVGIFLDSPNWQGDPQAIQEGMRNEWN